MYFVLHVKKLKSFEVTSIGRHNERSENNKSVCHANEDIDPEKTKLNYNLVENILGTMLQRCNKRIEESGCKTRITKASVFVVEVVISASPEWFATADEKKRKLYFKKALKYFQEKYGKENIVSAVVHLDETTPHMHIDIVPLVKDRDKIKLSAKDLVGGKYGLQKWHTDFATYMHDQGFVELKRGENTGGVRHKTVEEYKAENAKKYKEQKRFKEELVEKLKPQGIIASLLKECRLSKEDAGHLIELLTSKDSYIAELEKENRILKSAAESLERKYHDENAKKCSLSTELLIKEREYKEKIDKLEREKKDSGDSYDKLNSEYQLVCEENKKYKKLCELADKTCGSIEKLQEVLDKEIQIKEAMYKNEDRNYLEEIERKIKAASDDALKAEERAKVAIEEADRAEQRRKTAIDEERRAIEAVKEFQNEVETEKRKLDELIENSKRAHGILNVAYENSYLKDPQKIVDAVVGKLEEGSRITLTRLTKENENLKTEILKLRKILKENGIDAYDNSSRDSRKNKSTSMNHKNDGYRHS